MRIFWLLILDFFLNCISLRTNECFFGKSFLILPILGELESFREDRACKEAAECALKQLQRALSIWWSGFGYTQNMPKRSHKISKNFFTLWVWVLAAEARTEHAQKPLRCLLIMSRCCWGAYRWCAEAAEALTEHAWKWLWCILSAYLSGCDTTWVYTVSALCVCDHICTWSRTYMIN